MGPVLRSAEGPLKFSKVGKINILVTVEVEATVTRCEFPTFRGHTTGILALDFSRDGRYFVTASNDRTLKMWNAGPIG
jgi:WD40 repeat protein